MDQNAFRALLSTPNPNQSSQTSRANGRFVLGGGSTSKSTNTLNSSGSTYKPASSATSLKPRKFKPKVSADGSVKDSDRSTHGGYRDRASERRQGLEGDFAEAEHLLENFQARVAAAGSQMDKDVLEQQTKYLGGDERHTILVKGLDHALLERRKAELLEDGKLDQVTDDDLEIAYQQSAKQAPPEDLALPSAKSKGSKKKHRDELLEQLKTSRAPADLVVVEKLKAAGKFKPIGFISPDDKKQDEERKERKRKKAEKKKNKALKTEPAADPTPFTNTSDSVTQNPQTQNDLPIPGTSIPVEKLAIDGNHISSPKSTQPSIQSTKDKASISILSETDIAVKKDEPIEDDDTFDIFGDAGEYKGLDAESSEDEQARDTKVEESTSLDVCSGYSPGKKRKNYFEDNECDSNHSEMLKSGEETACKTHDTLPKKMPIQEPEDDPAIGEHSTGDAPPSDQDPPRLTKLAGLSGSADIRSILAADALQEKEEKRKAKKQKNKSSGTKVLTDKDRLNRDVLEMENFLKRKKGRDNPPSANPES